VYSKLNKDAHESTFFDQVERSSIGFKLSEINDTYVPGEKGGEEMMLNE